MASPHCNRLFDTAKLVTRANEDNLTNSLATQVRHGITLGHDKNLGHLEFRIKGVHLRFRTLKGGCNYSYLIHESILTTAGQLFRGNVLSDGAPEEGDLCRRN